MQPESIADGRPLSIGTFPPRVGYVTKMFPRFSETFVLTEVLNVERLGDRGRDLLAPAASRRTLPRRPGRAPRSGDLPDLLGIRAGDLWAELARAAGELGDLGPHLPELLRLDVRDALQAVELARHVRQRGIAHLHAHFASAGTSVARVAAGDRRDHLRLHRARQGHLPRTTSTPTTCVASSATRSTWSPSATSTWPS